MEEGEGEGLERVDILEETETKKKAGPVPNPPTLPGAAVPLPTVSTAGDLPTQPPPLIE
jgi:hypothetical protein